MNPADWVEVPVWIGKALVFSFGLRGSDYEDKDGIVTILWIDEDGVPLLCTGTGATSEVAFAPRELTQP